MYHKHLLKNTVKACIEFGTQIEYFSPKKPSHQNFETQLTQMKFVKKLEDQRDLILRRRENKLYQRVN